MICFDAVRSAATAAFALCVLAAAPAAAEDVSPVREMMLVSGMVEQFGGMGEIYSAGIRQSPDKLPPEIVEGLAAIAVRHVDGEELLEELQTELELTLAPDQVAAITDFYRSPLGRRLREAEVVASRVEALQEQAVKREEILAELKGEPERLALARRIDAAILASELSATLAASMAQALMLGAAQSAEKGVPQEQIDAVEKQLTAMHGALVEEMRGQMLTSFGWTYRDISTEDLADYVVFLESEAARAAYASVFEVCRNYLSTQSVEIGKELGALIRSKRT